MLHNGDVPTLLKALKEGDKYIRSDAAETLAYMDDSSIVPALVNALKDEEYIVRFASAEALQFISDPAAVQGLIEAMLDRNSGIFAHAVYALAEICVEHDPSELHVLLYHDDPYIRLGAAYSLGDKAGIEGIQGFIDLVRYHISGDKSEFEKAGRCLIKIGSPAIPTLLEALKDDDEGVRRCAIWSLGEISDPITAPELVTALKPDEEGYVQQEILWALTQIATPETLAAVEEWRRKQQT